MKFLRLVLALYLFSGVAVSQTETNLASIRKAVESINRTAKFSKTTVKLENLSTEGGEATVFREKDQIRKIVAEIRGEMGYSITELYYKDEKLIFAYDREFRYEKPFGKVLKITPTRFYFDNEKIIKMFYAKREIFPEDKEYNEMRDRMIPLSKAIFDAVKAKAS
ncbi:MAG: hypothetical protein M3209_10905 [Acidobacteriota bacterium]|nr:hypothetical protein [Acidobacteriota bacterium]